MWAYVRCHAFSAEHGEELRTFRRVQAGEKDMVRRGVFFGGTLQARQDIGYKGACFSFNEQVIDGRKKVAETPIESLYTPNLLRKEEKP